MRFLSLGRYGDSLGRWHGGVPSVGLGTTGAVAGWQTYLYREEVRATSAAKNTQPAKHQSEDGPLGPPQVTV